jgi:hypothetical protein
MRMYMYMYTMPSSPRNLPLLKNGAILFAIISHLITHFISCE